MQKNDLKIIFDLKLIIAALENSSDRYVSLHQQLCKKLHETEQRHRVLRGLIYERDDEE